VVPGGVTRILSSWPPHPVYVRSGEGAFVQDLDGHRLLDLNNNYTALVLGHAHPEVLRVVTEQLEKGTSFGFSTELEVELAGMLVERVPSVERVRFTGSGTEAAMFALRTARAATGRSKVAKMECGFHGTHDDVSVSVRPRPDDAGPPERPRSVAEMDGLIPDATDNVVVLPFNRPTEACELIREHADDLAAVIVEPVLGVGGMIPPVASFLPALRQTCSEHGIILIFDEVITLRLAPGGGQEVFGVMPDLTVMGKVIGGGLPIGAVGGSAALMGMYDPFGEGSGGPRIYQAGTFTGNPLSLAAGIATLQVLTPEVCAELNERGDRIRHQLGALFEEVQLPAVVTGAGSLFNVHMTAGPIITARDAWAIDAARQHRFFLDLLSRGVVLAPRGMGAVSTAMTDADVDFFLEAAGEVASLLSKPGGPGQVAA
jgi:glutamate-1-semialdehyde 2,1-aminomutase